jgi:hypothetical protein
LKKEALGEPRLAQPELKNARKAFFSVSTDITKARINRLTQTNQ